MRSIKPVQKIIDAFEGLPGIGPKTASRLAYYLFNVPQERLEAFGKALIELKKKTRLCKQCFNISEDELCPVCDGDRERRVVCVVETSLDLLAIENSDGYGGIYHVLGGLISPLNNIGPEDIRIAELLARIKSGDMGELILAMSPSMEGEATAMYISQKVKEQGLKVKVTRIGRGLPVGADIEYADGQTLARALEGRREVE